MTGTLRYAGFLGVFIFGVAFALTFLSPIHYERAARGFLENSIEEQLREKLEIVAPGPGEGRLAQLVESFAKQQEAEISRLRERFTTGLDRKVAATVARMQDPGCECRQRIAQALDIATSLHISSLERAEPQLRRIIEGRYGEIVQEILRDLRIFTGTNLVAFALLLGLSFAKPGLVRPLFVPGVLLMVATVMSSAMYIFGQNWFFTLLYSDYVGTAYAVWLVLIYGFLIDIALFQARVTTVIVDALVRVFAGLFSVTPC